VRLLLLPAGSRGDVDPFLALYDRAVAEGHEVRVAVTRDAMDRAQSSGRDVVALDGDFEQLVASQGVGWGAARSYRAVVKPMLASIQASAARAVLDYRPDVVAYHPKVLITPTAAAAVGALAAVVEIVPILTPTSAFPAAGVVSRDLGRLNRFTFVAAAAGNAALKGTLGAVASDLGLPPVRTAPDLSLCPVSPTLIPRPADWPATSHLTGAWRPAGSSGSLPRDVEAFLADGDVIYAGFGSMAAGDPIQRARTVVTAIRATGKRALVATGWGGLEVPADLLGDDLLITRAVDHQQVLPRVEAAIHHGGAGTVHAATAAGTVSLLVPFMADQPWWGRRLHERGLAPRATPARRLTVDTLGTALEAAPTCRGAVAAAADRMATEDGTCQALKALAGALRGSR
jgi:sterol 3beta-glucosyltransferase